MHLCEESAVTKEVRDVCIGGVGEDVARQMRDKKQEQVSAFYRCDMQVGPTDTEVDLVGRGILLEGIRHA